jgi:hypothetical protein
MITWLLVAWPLASVLVAAGIGRVLAAADDARF